MTTTVSLLPLSFDDLQALAEVVKASGLAPAHLDSSSKILVALMRAIEDGREPLAALGVRVDPDLPSSAAETAASTVFPSGADGPAGQPAEDAGAGPLPPVEAPASSFYNGLFERLQMHLEAAKTAEEVRAISDESRAAVSRLTPPQQVVVAKLFDQTFARIDEEKRQRIEEAGGRGVREYMDEDREDAKTARAVKRRTRDPFDAAHYPADDADVVLRLTEKALKTATEKDDAETAKQLHAVLYATAAIREKLIEPAVRKDIVKRATPLFDKFGLK